MSVYSRIAVRLVILCALVMSMIAFSRPVKAEAAASCGSSCYHIYVVCVYNCQSDPNCEADCYDAYLACLNDDGCPPPFRYAEH